MSIPQLADRLRTEVDAYRYLKDLRWGDRPICPHCGSAGEHYSEGEYVSRGSTTTNHAEMYFSQLKRSPNGTHHHISVEHLHRYLAEFDFRYTTCKDTDSERMDRIVSQTGGRRLTYAA